ncbi:hypothetical protein QT711_03230 [Sporosarcina saromensis]|uniref:DUF3102 domain-containing protein n=1 Tax=Sporosarcina saromensis TaxID=359365 RepID=A0ABU4G5D6_9BACL|nr:hypothetical protein [Sporosarcina saromensis]MDW0112183.1 hypothetical protein [Sporosarcina saromensis]
MQQVHEMECNKFMNEQENVRAESAQSNTAQFLRTKENNMREIVGKAYTELGRELAEARDRLAGSNQYDGVFGKWLSFMKYPQRTAYELINRYAELLRIPQEQVNTFEALPISLSKTISAKSAESTSAKAQAKEEVLSGEIDTLKKYQERISEKVDWAKRLERIERIKAKGRQGNRTDLNSSNIVENSPQSKTRDAVAEKSGFGSSDTYRKAKFIDENADEDTIQKLDSQEISIHKAWKETKEKLEKKLKEEEEYRKLVEEEMKKARTICPCLKVHIVQI